MCFVCVCVCACMFSLNQPMKMLAKYDYHSVTSYLQVKSICEIIQEIILG